LNTGWLYQPRLLYVRLHAWMTSVWSVKYALADHPVCRTVRLKSLPSIAVGRVTTGITGWRSRTVHFKRTQAATPLHLQFGAGVTGSIRCDRRAVGIRLPPRPRAAPPDHHKHQRTPPQNGVQAPPPENPVGGIRHRRKRHGGACLRQAMFRTRCAGIPPRSPPRCLPAWSGVPNQKSPHPGPAATTLLVSVERCFLNVRPPRRCQIGRTGCGRNIAPPGRAGRAGKCGKGNAIWL
jgi:hypothetical protein